MLEHCPHTGHVITGPTSFSPLIVRINNANFDDVP